MKTCPRRWHTLPLRCPGTHGGALFSVRHINGGDAVLDEGEQPHARHPRRPRPCGPRGVHGSRPAPLKGQIGYLIKQLGRAKAVAQEIGVTVETHARFGYTAPVGITDDGRVRRLTVHLAVAYSQWLLDARDVGVTLNDIDYLDLDY